MSGYVPTLKNFPTHYFSSGDYLVDIIAKRKGKDVFRFKLFGTIINI
jgi:hypothetical protein